MDNNDKFNELISVHGLERIRANILRSAKPSIEIRLSDSPNSSVGQSRFGGTPDLPSPELWPSRGKNALTFIGQIRLDDLRDFPAAAILPSLGILSFFYDMDLMPWGFNTTERISWRVLYFNDTSSLRPAAEATQGLTPESIPRLRASFVPSLTVPALRSIELDPLDMSEDEFTRYWDFREEVSMLGTNDPNAPLHRLLGHPDAVQGCMQRTAQFASRDEMLPEGVYSYYEHPRAKELIPGSFDWRLLLQVDSDERLDVGWGDAGRIYYWLHQDDLAARNFDNSWLFLQCH